MARKKPPELTFQQHIADFLIREHKYGMLEQTDITDTEHFIAEDQLWAFLRATQADTLQKLEDDYGTDARDEVFKALHKEMEHTPLWDASPSWIKSARAGIPPLLPKAPFR